MKKNNLFLLILFALFTAGINESCKNKSKSDTDTTTQGKGTDRVEINSDSELKSSVDLIIRDYNSVEADVKDGVITLRGNIKDEDLQTLMVKVQELKPKKVDNQLVIVKN